MSSLGDRIKEAANRIGGLDVLSGYLEGVSRRTLSDYVSGKSEPRISTVIEIATATKTDLNALLLDKTLDPSAGSGGFLVHAANGSPKIVDPGVTVPRYDVRASQGAGALVVSERVEEYFSVGRDWLRRNLPPWAPPNALVGILEGAGDSMEPTIRDGDLVMVVQDVDWRVVERGGIFVFSLDHDRLLLKRLQVLNNGDLRIISDNKAYEPDLVGFADIPNRVRVHGQVFFAGGKPRSY